MSVAWITVNTKLKEGIKLVNALSTPDVILLLNRLSEAKGTPFNAEDFVKFQDTFGLNEANIQLLIQSIGHILKQSSKFILKPTVLRKQLVDELGLQPEKSDEFVKKWTERTKQDFEDLENRYRLESVSWQLNVETASTGSSKQADLKGRLQLDLRNAKTDTKDDFVLELNEEELLQLYQTLENVQVKLDSVNNFYNSR